MTSKTPPPDPKTSHQVAFDWQDWLPYLAEMDIPETQKQAHIEALWAIILEFVDLGFDVKASQEICGEHLDLSQALRAAVLQSDDTEEDAA